MKILLLSQYFPPEIGAAPHRAFYHAKNWVQMGHDVTVVTNVPNSPHGKIYDGHKNKLYQKENVEGVTVARLLTLPAGKKSNIITRFLSSLFYIFMSQLFLFRKKPDVIVGSVPYFAGFAAFILAKIRRVPLVYEMRDPWLQIIEKNVRQAGLYFKILKKMENFCLHRADRVVVIGRRMSDTVARHYKLKEKPLPVFNGIEISDIAEIPQVPTHIEKETQNMLKICFVGNLGVWYDVEGIIEAATILKDKNITFVFVGDGKLKKDLVQKTEALKLKNILIYDALPHKQALAVVQHADLSILPFKKGVCDLCLPLKFFESLALGTPVLVCNGDEVEIIVGQSGSGAVFDSNQPRQLTEIIESYTQQPQLLKSQGEKGSKFIVENYNRTLMAKKYLELFTTLINK